MFKKTDQLEFAFNFFSVVGLYEPTFFMIILCHQHTTATIIS